MSGIFGLLGLNESDYAYINTAGQALVYTATQQYLDKANQDMNDALSVFVEGITEGYTERYKLPGGGRLQRRSGRTRSGAVKAYGKWDVAYPLEDFGAEVADTDVAMAYMTPQEYQRHIDTVLIQNANTVRFEILRRLFKNTTDTFVDEIWGSLTIQPLANGDSVVYPPVMGSETEAIEDHYYGANYAATSISNSNNPYITLREDLEHHFGAPTGGANVVAFINSAETPETEALTSFVDVPDNYIRSGTASDIPVNLPGVPGRIIGRTNGVWVSEWSWIPSGYIFGLHLEEPAPLKMRVDPAGTGLGRGLQLVAREKEFPIESATWRHRFGVGTGNRLNGVAIYLTASTSYTIPSIYQ